MAQKTTGYVRLSSTTIDRSRVIKDLRDLGYQYVLQKALFADNNKYNLPTILYDLFKTESIYRRTTGRVAYYKYTVQVTPDGGNNILRAIYSILFDTTTGTTRVTSYSYSLAKKADGPYIADAASYLDVRGISNDTFLEPQLLRGVNFTVENATRSGQIRGGTYQVGTVFSASNSGYSITNAVNFLITLVSNTGYTYRTEISVPGITSVSMIALIEGDNSVAERPKDRFPISYVIYPNNE